LKKCTAEKQKKNLDQRLHFTHPKASIKDVQVTKKHSALKREHPALQNMKYLNFFSTFVGHYALLDPDPDSEYGSGSETLVTHATV